MKALVNLTQQLIEIESTNPGSGEKNLADFIVSYLKDCGTKIILQEVEKHRHNVIAILGESLEKEVPKFVLSGHMDTVVVGDGWTKSPFKAEIVDDCLYGRGSCDMKSGLACALMVFKETALKVKKQEIQLKRPLMLLCSVDEEADMKGIEAIIKAGYISKEDWVMDLEPTDGMIQMSHKGRLWIKLTVKGITAHASRPQFGADAIAAMAEIICYIRKMFYGKLWDWQDMVFLDEERMDEEVKETLPTITFGQIDGGYQPYVVPDLCQLYMDIRLAPPFEDQDIFTMLDASKDMAEKLFPGVKVDYEVTGNRPYIEKNENAPLLKTLIDVCEKVTGEHLEAQLFPGYTDTAVIAGMLQNKNCLSYGPGSLSKAHKPDECVEIKDIKRCHDVLSELVKVICIDNPKL